MVETSTVDQAGILEPASIPEIRDEVCSLIECRDRE
jgi:hypothetical protein